MLLDIHPDAMVNLINGDHGAPYQILGPQPSDDGQVSIRAFQPGLERMIVVNDVTGERHEMNCLREEGLFEVTIAGSPSEIRYHYEAQTKLGADVSFHDAYAFPLQITHYD